MTRFMNDIALTQERDALEYKLKDVKERIKTIPKIKEIFKYSYHENIKISIGQWGDWQELHISYDVDKEEGVWFSKDEFEKIYDFGWHVCASSTDKNRFELFLRRNEE